MREVLLLPCAARATPFSAFLGALFRALGKQGVRFCVLRNYEGFPDENAGGDIDLVIAEKDLAAAVRALRLLAGIRLTGYSERSWVAHAFLEGVGGTAGQRALQVDFLWNLSWKGITYAPTETLLHRALPRRAGGIEFLVPSAVDEAIASLFASLLKSAWLKEKYFAKARDAMTSNRDGAIAALRGQFGTRASERLVDTVIASESVEQRAQLIRYVKPLRWSMAIRAMMRRPIETVTKVVRHYWPEMAVRYAPGSVEAVRVLSFSQARAEDFADALVPMLYATAKFVERGRSGPWTAGALRPEPTLDVARRLAQEWWRQVAGKTDLTLRILDGSAATTPMDAEASEQSNAGLRTRGLVRRRLGSLFPKSDLWVYLDQPMTDLPMKRQPMQRQLMQDQPMKGQPVDAPWARYGTARKVLVFDRDPGHDSADERLRESAYEAIVEALAERTKRLLDRRFGSAQA
jgi:hypothetical protein